MEKQNETIPTKTCTYINLTNCSQKFTNLHKKQDLLVFHNGKGHEKIL